MSSNDDPIHGGRKVYRKRKRFQGGTWTPPSMSAETGDGLWCRKCKQRHGYKVMGLDYEQASDGSGWRLLWSCPRWHDVIGTTEPGPKGQSGVDGKAGTQGL